MSPDPDEEELSRTLEDGALKAKALVEHMVNDMGASGAEIPVLLQDEKYVVTIRKEAVKTVEQHTD